MATQAEQQRMDAIQVDAANRSLDQLRRRYADLQHAQQVAPQTLSPDERIFLQGAPAKIQEHEAEVAMMAQKYGTVGDLSGQGGTIGARNLTLPGQTAAPNANLMVNPGAVGTFNTTQPAVNGQALTTNGLPSGAGAYVAQQYANQNGTQQSLGNGQAAQPSGMNADSEIARAKDVYARADQLAGTGKYVGQTADQVRANAHNYAEDIRAGRITFNNGQMQGDPGALNNASTVQSNTLSPQNPQSTPPPLIDVGNPEMNAVANGYIQSMWKQWSDLSSNPMLKPLSDDDIKSITSYIDKQLGPEFATARQKADLAFTTQQHINQGLDKNTAETLAYRTTRGQEDVNTGVAKLEGDKGRQLTVQARNYQQAQNETAANFAARNRTFSGDRVAQERLQSTQDQEQRDAIARAAKEGTDALNLAQTRSVQDTGLESSKQALGQQQRDFGLGVTHDTALQNVEDIRKTAIENQKQQIQDLPFKVLPSMINKPSVFPTASTTAPLTTASTALTQVNAPTRTIATPSLPTSTIKPNQPSRATYVDGAAGDLQYANALQRWQSS